MSDAHLQILDMVRVPSLTLTTEEALRFSENMRKASRNTELLRLIVNGPPMMMVKIEGGLVPTLARVARDALARGGVSCS